MIVCVCLRVSDRDIRRHAQDGCHSFDELQLATGVSTSCGRCKTCARDTFQQAHRAEEATCYLRQELPAAT